MTTNARVPPSLEGVLAMSDATCAELREVCVRAGYTEATIAIVSSVPRTVQGAPVPLLRRALLGGSSGTNDTSYAAGVLALLFACHDDIGEATIREVMGDSLTDALLASGFIGPSSIAGSVTSGFLFLPLEGLWLLGDHVANGNSAVMPPGPTTGELVGVMPGRVNGRVLDIGCGPGSLSLVAARRGAEWASGTDINPRAIEMAGFNARFNEISNVTFTVGDLIEPVRGERFELVVAQPPFVVQPPDTAPITFLHGGPTGEAITQRIVAALPEVLLPSARALILAEIPSQPSEPVHQRVRNYLGEAPMDVVVLTMRGSSPEQQAMRYASLEASEDGAEYAAAVARYVDHLEAMDIDILTHVLIIVRARDMHAEQAAHRFSATVPIKGLSFGDGAAIDALMTALELASVDDDSLAATKLRASPFAHWIEERTTPDPAEEPTRSVRFGPGQFAADVENLSASAFRLAGLINGMDTVEDAAREHARTSGLQWSEARAQTLRFAREALGRGLLERPVE